MYLPWVVERRYIKALRGTPRRRSIWDKNGLRTLYITATLGLGFSAVKQLQRVSGDQLPTKTISTRHRRNESASTSINLKRKKLSQSYMLKSFEGSNLSSPTSATVSGLTEDRRLINAYE